MLQVFSELAARKEPDDQLDLRICAWCVSHRECPDAIRSRYLDVDELARGEPHLRRADETQGYSAYRRCQVRDPLYRGLEGLDLITGLELLIGQTHRRDVDDTVGERLAGTQEGPAIGAVGRGQRKARSAVLDIPLDDQRLAGPASAMLASVAEEISLGERGAQNGHPFGALDGAVKGANLTLGTRPS